MVGKRPMPTGFAKFDPAVRFLGCGRLYNMTPKGKIVSTSLARRSNSILFPCTALEARRLLSITLHGKGLLITGTSGDDEITISRIGDVIQVEMNDHAEEFSSDDVNRITVRGGAGNDVVSNHAYDRITLIGGEGNDTLSAGPAESQILGGAGNDLLLGGSKNDGISADRDSDFGPILDGIDTIRAGGGHDGISSDIDADHIDGGSGDDTVSFGDRKANLTISLDNKNNDSVGVKSLFIRNIEDVHGGQGNDYIVGNSSENYLSSGRGNDTMFGLGGRDTMSTESGDDSLVGGSGNDEFHISKGTHVIRGDGGNDKVIGGWEAVATFWGGSGNDTVTEVVGDLRGQAGDDSFRVALNSGKEDGYAYLIDGGSGNDALLFTINAGSVGIRVSLDDVANDGRQHTPDVLNVRDFEKLTGSIRADNLNAAMVDYPVTLIGLAGDDTLTGGAGADSLDGGIANDLITGNLGADTMIGNTGNDTFFAADSIADQIIGGSGTDSADIDDGLDVVSEVENVT